MTHFDREHFQTSGISKKIYIAVGRNPSEQQFLFCPQLDEKGAQSSI